MPRGDAGHKGSLYSVLWEHWGGSNLLCLGIASEGFPEEGTFELRLKCTQKEKTFLAKAGVFIWGLVRGGGPIP